MPTPFPKFNHRLRLSVSPEDATAIEDFRSEARFASKSEAVRYLLRRGGIASGDDGTSLGAGQKQT